MWSSSCLACYNGSYCPNNNMVSLKNTSCSSGNVCNNGSKSLTDAVPCSNGMTANQGSPICLPCFDGYYSTNSKSCQTCPYGDYCDNTNAYLGQSVAQACTVSSLCTGGDARQPLCNDGYFLLGSKCTICPPGSYCIGGAKAGQCDAGYFCPSGSSSPTPAGQLCSPNYYCNMGANQMTPCPAGYFNPNQGGMQLSDCVQCMAGYICNNTGGTPFECPAGYYCVLGDTTAIPCPRGTYSQLTGISTQSQCANCPAGYFCNKTGIASYYNYTCPLGMYCTERTLQPLPCRPGTFRSTLGARSPQECLNCPEGSYCPLGSIKPIPCLGGMYCPASTAINFTCNGGYYCNAETQYQQQICPPNYFCPRGSTDPKNCSGRIICPEGSEIGYLCEAGYYVVAGQYGFENQCLQCPSGTYSTVNNAQCQVCTAGYLCYGATNRAEPTDFNANHGVVCPKGFYCPAGSSTATPCPQGTYNALVGATDITQCTLCPDDTFNNLVGQSGCQSCGTYASSLEGALTCTCKGDFRTFSLTDASCRCQSGYQYIDPTSNQNIGSSSGNDDCTPTVYDRCYGLNETRDEMGNCVSTSNCTSVCPGGQGLRSTTTGICSCTVQQNVDTVCNQECRNNGTSISVNANGTVIITKNGVSKPADLSQVGDVYGSFSCSSTNSESCTVNNAEMGSSGGFGGCYGSPSLITNGTNSSSNSSSGHSSLRRRILASTGSIDPTSIQNPVYCTQIQQSFMFTIRNPFHYPVYATDSVLNSNEQFDYGAFLNLKTSMLAKQAANDNTPSLFGFTFTQKGSYLFQDAGDPSQIMLIKVMDLGESCPDSDRYIQPMSGQSVASAGITYKSNLIIKPDVPLLVSMGMILLFSVAVVMVGIGYCLHKGWKLPRADLRGFRNKYFKVDIEHTNEDTFSKNNDFNNYKSHLGDDESEEDDLDNINLNIHQDLLEAGQEYLKIFDDKKVKRLSDKKEKKQEIMRLMKELEDMVSAIGSDAMTNQMAIYNKDNADDAGGDEEEVIARRRQKELQIQQEKEKRQQETEELKRQQMMKEWNERDLQKLTDTKNKMMANTEALKKELNKDINGSGGADGTSKSEDLAMAIYDGGDINSRHNQIVRQIENSHMLSEEEKENLLSQHQKQLMQIDDIMDNEKKKQDSELEGALKEWIEKRKKALEQQYKKEIQKDTKDQEKEIRAEIELQKQEGIQEIENDIQSRMDELSQDAPPANYRKWVEDLKKEREQRKLDLTNNLEKDFEKRVKSMKEDVINKYTSEAGINTEEELEALLKEQCPGMDTAISEMRQQKQDEEQKLKEMLKKRKRDMEARFKVEKDKFEQEIMSQDPIKEEEIEKKKKELLKNQQVVNESIMGNDLAALKQQQPDSQEQDLQAQFQSLLKDIDSQTMANNLLDQLKEQDSNITDLMKQSEQDQDQKLEARRELLRQRKMLKKQQEQEQERLNERMKQLQIENDTKFKIEQNYIKDVFQKQVENLDKDTPESQQQRMILFNEYLSDAFLQRLSNLLMKQFLEKEAALKLLVQKYMDQRLVEKAAIKKAFQRDYDKLNQVKSQISDQEYQDHLKNLRVKEENLLRDVDLQFDKLLKEEEMKVRADLERSHTEEQISLKRAEVDEMVRMRKDLGLQLEAVGGDKGTISKEEEKERQNLKQYEDQKQREQDRKIRSMAMQKQDFLREVDKELKNHYHDYEDLLHRKRDEESQLQEQTISVRKKLQDRKKKIREQGMQQLSAEDQRKMIESHAKQLENLESVFEEERRRQAIMMKKRLQQKKQKAEKQKDLKQKVDEQEVDSIKVELGKTFGAGGFFKASQEAGEDSEDDDELLKRLKEWRLRRYQLKKREEERQLGETVVELDPLMIKKLVMRLDSLEKSLRELKKLKGLGDPNYKPKNFMQMAKMQSESSAFTMERDYNSKAGTVRAVSQLEVEPPQAASPQIGKSSKFGQLSQSPDIVKNISLIEHPAASTQELEAIINSKVVDRAPVKKAPQGPQGAGKSIDYKLFKKFVKR